MNWGLAKERRNIEKKKMKKKKGGRETGEETRK